MAEFDFYCTRDECRELLDAVLRENHLRCAVDQWYSSPTCPIYSEADEALVELVYNTRRQVYLLGAFTTKGLPFRRQPEGDRAGWYDIDSSRLGPLIELSLPGWFLEDGVRRIGSANLHRMSQYWNADLTECEKASLQLRTAYTGIKRTLKKSLLPVELTEPVWISRAALDLVEQRRATILVNGRWVCGPSGDLSVEKRSPP